jgi:hypothetical protein
MQHLYDLQAPLPLQQRQYNVADCKERHQAPAVHDIVKDGTDFIASAVGR